MNAPVKNVVDKYREWEVDLIREDLHKNSFPYAILMEQWQGDFNFSQCIRNANAFGAREIFYIGKRRYDKRGAVGTYNYTYVKHLPSFDELLKLKEIYTFIGIDNIDGSVPVENYVWPTNPLLIFGEEGCGLTSKIVDICESVVKISQYGSVRSLNAGTASGIICYDFVNKYVQKEHK